MSWNLQRLMKSITLKWKLLGGTPMVVLPWGGVQYVSSSGLKNLQDFHLLVTTRWNFKCAHHNVSEDTNGKYLYAADMKYRR